MPYHDNFWVTVGAAAPVIALASVISGADALRGFDDLERPDIAEKVSRDKSRRGNRLLWALLVLAGLNLAGEGFALLFALLSLATGSNQMPPAIAATIVPAGIALVVLSGTLAVELRSLRRDIKTELKEGQPDPVDVRLPADAAAGTRPTGSREMRRSTPPDAPPRRRRSRPPQAGSHTGSMTPRSGQDPTRGRSGSAPDNTTNRDELRP